MFSWRILSTSSERFHVLFANSASCKYKYSISTEFKVLFATTSECGSTQQQLVVWCGLPLLVYYLEFLFILYSALTNIDPHRIHSCRLSEVRYAATSVSYECQGSTALPKTGFANIKPENPVRILCASVIAIPCSATAYCASSSF